MSAFLLFAWWENLRGLNVNVLDLGQKVAFVFAAFSVTAYNLRTRVIDLMLKIEANPSRIAQLSLVARSCGQKLTELVLLFTFTALLLAAVGFVPITHRFAIYFATFAWGWAGVSTVQFIYILFTFEKLERFMLDDAEIKARVREAERLGAN